MKKQTCKCICHDTIINKPYEHDTWCCQNMHGYLENLTPQGDFQIGQRFVSEEEAKKATEQPPQDWKERFIKKFAVKKPYWSNDLKEGVGIDELVDFIQEIRKEILEEAIKLADKIESEAMNMELNEWRAFKHFRNTLREEIKLGIFLAL